MPTELHQVQSQFEEKLDLVEDTLPALPAAALRVQRRMSERVVADSQQTAKAVLKSARTVTKVANDATRTVVGTARWTLGRALATARIAAKTVAGQTRAQAERTSETIGAETQSMAESARTVITERGRKAAVVVDNVADEIDPSSSSGRAAGLDNYDDWTRSELYDRAQEVDIDGRSSMNKSELIEALRTRRV